MFAEQFMPGVVRAGGRGFIRWVIEAGQEQQAAQQHRLFEKKNVCEHSCHCFWVKTPDGLFVFY
jgi:hypothetical protein